MTFHDCMPVLLSTGCLSTRCSLHGYLSCCPLAVCPYAAHWLSVLLSTGCLSCCSLAVCLFAAHCMLSVLLSTGCLSVRCPLSVCLYAVHWLSVYTLSAGYLSCYDAIHWLSVLLFTGCLSVRCLGRISIRQLHVIARICTLQQHTSTF